LSILLDQRGRTGGVDRSDDRRHLRLGPQLQGLSETEPESAVTFRSPVEWTKDVLYDRALDLDIEGRWTSRRTTSSSTRLAVRASFDRGSDEKTRVMTSTQPEHDDRVDDHERKRDSRLGAAKGSEGSPADLLDTDRNMPGDQPIDSTGPNKSELEGKA